MKKSELLRLLSGAVRRMVGDAEIQVGHLDTACTVLFFETVTSLKKLAEGMDSQAVELEGMIDLFSYNPHSDLPSSEKVTVTDEDGDV